MTVNFSTYFATVNRVLRHAGQTEIADVSTFNTNASLTKTQLQAKSFVDLADRLFQMDLPAEYRKREGAILGSFVDGNNSANYTTNNAGVIIACRIESVIPDSWYITSPTTAIGRVYAKDYLQWRAEGSNGATGSTLATYGRPNSVIPIPGLDSVIGSYSDKVRFDPVPDRDYTIKYLYYSDPAALTVGADYISWEPQVEPVLWLAAGKYLESSLGEGRMPDFADYLIPFLTKARQMTLGLAEITPRANFGYKISPRGATRSSGTKSAWSPN